MSISLTPARQAHAQAPGAPQGNVQSFNVEKNVPRAGQTPLACAVSRARVRILDTHVPALNLNQELSNTTVSELRRQRHADTAAKDMKT